MFFVVRRQRCDQRLISVFAFMSQTNHLIRIILSLYINAAYLILVWLNVRVLVMDLI